MTPDEAAAKAAEVLEEARHNGLDQRYVSNLVTIADAWMRLSAALASMPQALEPVMSVNMPDGVDVDAVAAALYARLGGRRSETADPFAGFYLIGHVHGDGVSLCCNREDCDDTAALAHYDPDEVTDPLAGAVPVTSISALLDVAKRHEADVHS